MKYTICFFLLLVLSICESVAQDVSFVPFENIALTLQELDAHPAEAEIKSELDGNIQEFALYALGRQVYTSLVEEARIDKQVGATGGSSGSTSLVTKGSVPSLVGLAVEGGALYQSISNSIVTLRLNPSGLARALAKNSYLLAGPPLNQSAIESVAEKFSFSTSLDLNQGASPGTFTGERSQLREMSFRFSIINKRDPRHPSHEESIERLRGRMGPLVATVQGLFDVLRKMPGYEDWKNASATKLSALDLSNDKGLMAALTEIGADFARRFASHPEFKRLAGEMVKAIESYRTVRDSVFEDIAKGSTLSFEYSFSRLPLPEEALSFFPPDSDVPNLSTARLIFSSPVGSFGEATLNGSVTFFNSTLSQMHGNLRDIQVSAGLDIRLPEIQSVGRPVLTFAGLGVFLNQQPFGVKVDLQGVETEDGAIGVFQAMLTFPAGRSGVRIPLSFTVANRSEFNTENEVRGAIGLTFDMDKLFSRP